MNSRVNDRPVNEAAERLRAVVERVSWPHDWHLVSMFHGPPDAEWLNAEEGWVECNCFERANAALAATSTEEPKR